MNWGRRATATAGASAAVSPANLLGRWGIVGVVWGGVSKMRLLALSGALAVLSSEAVAQLESNEAGKAQELCENELQEVCSKRTSHHHNPSVLLDVPDGCAGVCPRPPLSAPATCMEPVVFFLLLLLLRGGEGKERSSQMIGAERAASSFSAAHCCQSSAKRLCGQMILLSRVLFDAWVFR